MKKLLLLATSAIVVSAFPALAQDVPAPAVEKAPAAEGGKMDPRKHSMMMQADANGDGVITKDEFLVNSGRIFDNLDTDKNSKITADEIEAKKAEWRKKAMEMRDQRKAAKGKNAAGKSEKAPAAAAEPPASSDETPAQ